MRAEELAVRGDLERPQITQIKRIGGGAAGFNLWKSVNSVAAFF
jgi:hypothetical protein